MKPIDKSQEDGQNQSQSVFSAREEQDISQKLAQRLYASYSETHLLIPTEV